MELTKLNKTTKRAQHFIRSYTTSNKPNLDFCYTTYSGAKARAFKSCVSTMESLNGHSGRITSFTTTFFTYAFKAYIEGKDSLVVITPSNNFVINL